jgi:hypothetical protein
MTNPSASDVAKRLIILKYQVVHSMAVPPNEVLAEMSKGWSQNQRDDLFNEFRRRSDKLVASMKSAGLWNLMTKEEQQFLGSAPPRMNSQHHLNAMWRQESVAVLMWSIGLIEDFPPLDTQTNPEVMKLIPHEDLGGFISTAALLPQDIIEKQRSLAQLWHWRSRTRQLIKSGQSAPANSGFGSLDEIVRHVVRDALKRGELAHAIDNDFPAKGKAYRELSDEDWSEVRSITAERHYALNWLCGFAPKNAWAKTQTPT